MQLRNLGASEEGDKTKVTLRYRAGAGAPDFGIRYLRALRGLDPTESSSNGRSGRSAARDVVAPRSADPGEDEAKVPARGRQAGGESVTKPSPTEAKPWPRIRAELTRQRRAEAEKYRGRERGRRAKACV